MKPHPLPALILPRITLLLVAIIVVIMQQLRVALCNEETDHMALLAIKSQLIDQHPEEGVLRSWNHSYHHCSWDGVICGRKHKRVVKLRLNSTGLVGTISPFMGNLSFLRFVSFTNNSLHGQIPPQIGRLFRLQALYLYNNSLIGEIPANISGCINLQNFSVAYNNLQGKLPLGLGVLSNLKFLWICNNHFTGPFFKVIANLTSLEVINGDNNAFTGTIPHEIGRLFRLQSLNLYNNSLIGELPANISNCINLQTLSIGYNNLQGGLPSGLGALSNLKFLWVENNHFRGPLFNIIANLTSLEVIDGDNNAFTGIISDNISKMTNLYVFALMSNKLIGMIPPSVFNLSSLEILSLGMNQLQGSIPQDIAFTLPRLQHLLLYNNYLSGPFPMSLPNLTSILRIELSTNHFSGKIPAYLGRLHNLKHLELDVNSFVGDISFINSLVNCSQLEVLYLGANNFTGTLPQSIANLSTNLLVLDISKNPISNRGIPVGISNLNNLRYLWLSGLGLTGTIPQDIGKLQKLEWLDLYSNKLIGEIPSSLGNLSRLSRLYLYDNQLQGKIAPSLGNCANLLYLSLSYNRFNGSLPNELFAKTNFIQLNLGFNHLEGFLPMEIGKQINMEVFVVSRNKFIGEIPTVFGSLPDLQYLYMGDNFFHGPVPPSFITSLKSLLELDLSLNNLSGPVPEDASSFPLIYLNLSYNNFEGRVPTKGVYLNATAISLVGNNKLCGGISALHLPICVEKDRKKRRMTFALKLTIIVICTFVGVLVMLTCIWLYFTSLTRKRKSVSSDAPVKESHLKVSYNMLLKATEGFCSENLLGSGSFGSVFKGTLDGKTVAVKVLNLQHRGGSKSFMAECEALRNIRHRNLVGILTVCSSTDFQRNDFKALIYELMPNGSLENWLHRDRNLSLLQRLDIAIDVAYALNYLHHECDNQIVHCDLKPSNILLDHDMVAHVADFGLAKVLGLSQHPNQSSSVGVRGTIGYVAPEYGLGGEVSPEADLYSFGILLLELMTRKRPTNEMFKEDFNLHMYAKGALPDQVLQIVDTTQLIEHENGEDDNRQPRTQTMLQMKEECIVSVVKIGVACSNQSPSDRMNMIAAISELQRAKKILVH